MLTPHLTQICRFDQGVGCCRYLGYKHNDPPWVCWKLNPRMKGIVDRRWEAERPLEQGDNCPGINYFTILYSNCMLIPFPELIEKHRIRPTGVFHIGASTGQEAESYYMCGVHKMVFIEAIPEVYQDLRKHIERFPDAIAINACIGEQDGEKRVFHVSSNGGESSSLFEFGLHAKMHPDVTFVRDIDVETTRVDTLISRHDIDLAQYDFLNVDLQGAELLALRSMNDLLWKIKYVYIEVNTDHLYKDCPLIGEIDAHLAMFGFSRIDAKMTDKHWGDAFYIRSAS